MLQSEDYDILLLIYITNNIYINKHIYILYACIHANKADDFIPPICLPQCDDIDILGHGHAVNADANALMPCQLDVPAYVLAI